MIETLSQYPLLLLFIVSATGYAIGRIKVKGSSLGVAAVLFVGLAAGALDPRLALPEIVYELGLIIFVYTIGLSSGAGFFASFRRKGLRDNLFVLAMLLFAAGLAAALHFLFRFKPTISAGLYAGSLTNTPALAGLLDAIGGGGWGPIVTSTLIVRGAQSDVVSDEGMADALRRMPTARAADVATAGHMVAGDLNEVARELLVETITQSFACDARSVKIRAGRYARKDRAASRA